jgi:hypothetical protein
MCFSSTPTRDYGQEMSDTLRAQVEAMTGTGEFADLGPLAKLESEQIPQWTANQLDTYNRMLFGTGGQPGVLDQYGRMQPQLTEFQTQANTAQRTADIGDITALGPQAYGAMRAYNPQQTALLDAYNQQAMQGLQLGSQMDPATLSQIKNLSLGKTGGNGWGFDPASLASYAGSTGQAGEALRQTRLGNAGTAMSLNQALMGDPFLQILGRSSGVSNPALALSGQGQAGASNLGPNLYNPESAYAGNLNNANQQAHLASEAANLGMWGSIVESAGNVAGGMFCWVAREVYGETDPRWRLFRMWLSSELAPAWFRALYLRHGPAFAAWLHLHPRLKPWIKLWMNGRVETVRRELVEVKYA